MCMPAPISIDLRIRIIEARARDGQTYEQIAERFGVGRATVDRMLRLARETGSVEPAPHGGGTPPRIGDAEREALHELVRARPDSTLEGLCLALADKTGVEISRSTMCRELHLLGLARKHLRWQSSPAQRRSSRSRPTIRSD